ncbi:unnamed protein product [Heterosigma akashiwo]
MGCSGHKLNPTTSPEDPSKNVFDFVVKDHQGNDVALSDLRGKKAILVVNVASK